MLDNNGYVNWTAETVAYGHIHGPYVRRLDRFTITNSGSVGSPLDGCPPVSRSARSPRRAPRPGMSSARGCRPSP
jgi:hypothetical protein